MNILKVVLIICICVVVLFVILKLGGIISAFISAIAYPALIIGISTALYLIFRREL